MRLFSLLLAAGLLVSTLGSPAKAMDPQIGGLIMGLGKGLLQGMMRGQQGHGAHGHPHHGHGRPYHGHGGQYHQPYTFTAEDGFTCTVTHRPAGRGTIASTHCTRPRQAAPEYAYGEYDGFDDENPPPGSYLAPD